MVNYKYADLFLQSHVEKQLKIVTDDGKVTITNKDLYFENFELNESLCSESELTFGCCEASSVKFRIANVFTPLKNKWFAITTVLDGNTDEPFKIGRYKVYSDVPTADRRYRDIVAYDSMYDIINANVAKWYESLTFPMTLKAFRNSFFAYLGIEQEEITLVNDNMIVEKTVTPNSKDGTYEKMSGKDVITSICEINGCFGHINHDGKFRYVYLEQSIQGLYPANDLYPDHAPDILPQSKTGHLYPQTPKGNKIGKSFYKSADYEDFIVEPITKLQIRKEENDIGVIVGSGDNTYIIEDNFLVYGKSSTDLATIGNNVYGKIANIIYRPFSAECVGNPCIEIGDPVRFNTKYEMIESYALQRTLTGIQELTDKYEAEGTEFYDEKVNSVHSSLIELKGKSNTLERTIEETNSTIKSVEDDLRSQIKQTVKSISLTIGSMTDSKEIGITITAEKGDGSQDIKGTIKLTGLVSFTNLSTSGQTTIDGGNITTGEINCNLLNGGEIVGQILKGGGSEGGIYNFEVNNSNVVARNKFYLQDTDGTTYLKFDGTGKGKLTIDNVVLKLGDSIRLDPETNKAVFSTPQRILIKGKGNSPGTWDTSLQESHTLSDGTKIKAWDIGDAIQFICRHEIDARLKSYGLIS